MLPAWMAPMRPAPNWQKLIMAGISTIVVISSPLGERRGPIAEQWEGEGSVAAACLARQTPHPPRFAGPLPPALLLKGPQGERELPPTPTGGQAVTTIRLTMAQALVRFLAAQRTLIDGAELPLFAGVFAIFGHGNVAGLGEALHEIGGALPTLRAHNEQAMAHAAIAFAKTLCRRRMMACTSSIGPGATNMVTACALAHANRLPVLLLPGDVFAGRRPDPVLQQVENFSDPTLSVNDCFRPVSRLWDRITRPAQILQSLPQAMRVL